MVGKKESTTSYNLAYEVFVQGLAGEPENKDFVSRHNRAIQFNIEGEESFIVDVQDGNVDVRKGVLDDPDLAVVANPDVFRQVFGQVFAV